MCLFSSVVERRSRKAKVTGSIPVVGIKIYLFFFFSTSFSHYFYFVFDVIWFSIDSSYIDDDFNQVYACILLIKYQRNHFAMKQKNMFI
jgi:hypothetical protein